MSRKVLLEMTTEPRLAQRVPNREPVKEGTVRSLLWECGLRQGQGPKRGAPGHGHARTGCGLG